jgi:hypothetical protein
VDQTVIQLTLRYFTPAVFPTLLIKTPSVPGRRALSQSFMTNPATEIT